jgi:hypothetical protein
VLQGLPAGRAETRTLDGRRPTRRAGHGQILRGRSSSAPQ